ncbi:glycoside hydrolase family 32 protein [Emericellopsis atlantica]|uniref:Glycoside hydrolase family 32 protein n=1 Tax=Emericellopsis atlantica TaxID=2614577 RepID=A0A9P7ZHD2_9HYPO|nr:glycoside hydrolase family 32 protein [Emericellopsis atlantica]KAG9251857.1 glycoside hydrolase family 32 protein [Emericellopsis atlantica]
MRSPLVATTLSLTALTTAQNTTSAASASPSSTASYVNPDVPTGVPIVGDYDGQYRPQVHFSPPEHFMNDPNGMFLDDNGTWHLYYQYNPTGLVAGNQHWGHATSKDLYHWENQPIALFPPANDTFVFSGSAVTDPNNTSGFFPNQTNGVVAIYTLAQYFPTEPGPQTQAIAYSLDGGYSFIPYEGNPVIPSESSQFRDPKVIWYEDHWVMSVAYPHDFAIGIFTSPDLKEWTATSNFTHHGLLGLQYECPNMVRMPYMDEDGERQDDMWLMYISINPGAPVGGSIGQYFPGTFNGTHFEAVDAVARIADFGKDNYAGQFFYGLPEDELPVSIAWASNWQYTNLVPTANEGWRSAMSLPRRNYLTKTERIGWKLISEPYDLSPVIGRALAANETMGNGSTTVDFSQVDSNAVYWEANVTGIPDSGIPASATLNFTFLSPQSGEFVRGGYYFGGDNPFFVDRGGANGFDNVFFTDKFSTNSLITGDTWSMSGVMDRSMLEVFVNGGVDSASNTFFTTQPLTYLIVSAGDLVEGMEVSVRVHALESAWASMADEDDGLVYGNQTSSIGQEKMRRFLGAF